LLLLCHVVAQRLAIKSHKLNISPGEVIEWIFPEDNGSGVRRAIFPEVIKPEGSKLHRQISVVFFNHFRLDGLAAVGVLEYFKIKLFDNGIWTRSDIEGLKLSGL
jgi:hypothetical protein